MTINRPLKEVQPVEPSPFFSPQVFQTVEINIVQNNYFIIVRQEEKNNWKKKVNCKINFKEQFSNLKLEQHFWA